MGSAEEPLSKRLKVGGVEEREVVVEDVDDRELGPYDVPAEDVLRLCFIHGAEDVKSEKRASLPEEKWFCPTFTHQVFGQDEVVRGYESIQIRVYLHALTMHSFVEITCEGKQPGADDVRHMLTENLGLQFTEDVDEFIKQVKESEPLIERSLSNENATTCASVRVSPSETFEVVRFKPSGNCESSRVLKSLHDRLQAMPLLYVDAANYIDNTDPKWDIYLAVFRNNNNNSNNSSSNNSSSRSVAGFCTVYSFYAYPETQRLRLSQILVMPPFQRKGIASGILQKVYATAVERECTDLTVEDPSEEFQKVRERVDLKRILDAEENFYQKEVRAILDKSKAMLSNGMKAETLLLPTKTIYKKAEKELKIPKTQLRKVWEVLLLRELLRAAAEGDSSLKAASIIEQIVSNRLSSEASEKRLEKASEHKHVVDLSCDNFIMTRVHPIMCRGLSKVNISEEERAKSRENDKVRIQQRIQALEISIQ